MSQSNPLDVQTMINQGERAWREARYAEAEGLYQQSLSMRKRELGPAHLDLVPLLTALGELQQTQGRFAEAEVGYRRALTICEQGYGNAHAQTIEAIGNLAGILDEQNQGSAAEPLYQEALRLAEQVLGATHLKTALALAKLARFYRATGKYDLAEPLYQRALAIYGQNAEDPGNHAVCLNNFAALLLELDRPAQAEPLLRQALRMRARLSGPEHPALAANLKNLGRTYRAQGDTTLADLLYQRALAIYEQKLGRDHPDTIAIQQQIASLPVQ